MRPPSYREARWRAEKEMRTIALAHKSAVVPQIPEVDNIQCNTRTPLLVKVALAVWDALHTTRERRSRALMPLCRELEQLACAMLYEHSHPYASFPPN
jgi:hypothetical protein